MSSACQHHERECLNPYELLRKYRCRACGGVMLCACDEAFGRSYLPHQVDEGCELTTQRRIPVTLGFVAGTCDVCRGLPPTPHPVAAIHGRTSKIRRYYWREIAFETLRRLGPAPRGLGLPAAAGARPTYDEVEREVVEDVKRQHAARPTYTFEGTSQAELLEACEVRLIALTACAAPPEPSNTDALHRGAEDAEREEHDGGRAAPRRARLFDGDDVCTVETFAARHLERQGYSVRLLESRPLHALFGVMMWRVIQDSADPQLRLVSFGGRSALTRGEPTSPVWTHLPQDFGCPGYGARRRRAIRTHLRQLRRDTVFLLELFEMWRPASADLREYLWAHDDADVEAARHLAVVLPPDVIIRILYYLSGDYWGRYLGWPDLLAVRGAELLFAEVKYGQDRLSDEQKRWIRDNHRLLRLPFTLLKIHRQNPGVHPS